MSYKTILIHIDESRHTEARIKLAARIATRENAHLIGAATTGVSRYVYHAGMLDQVDPAVPMHLALHLELLRDRSRRALDNFEQSALRVEARSYESALIDDEAGAGISMRARYCDLAVIGQFDPDEQSPVVLPDFPEFVVMNSGRPVLIVPYAGRFDRTGQRALVAWDASTSATRALSNALPILKRADIVEVVVFNAEKNPDAHGEQPGADVGLWLARHGIKVDVIRRQTDADIGNALLSLAAELDSDLLVMGGYGHSRFREILLGGVTRTVLGSMTIPVLMSN